MREQRTIASIAEVEGSSELEATLFHLIGKRVRVIFDDSTRRVAKLTRLMGHEIKINGRGGRYKVDSLELDHDGGDLSDLRRVVSVDNLEESIG